MNTGNVDSFSRGEKAGMRGKATFLNKISHSFGVIPDFFTRFHQEIQT